MADRNTRWLPVVGWEGLYEVSSEGDVRSLPRKGASGRILKPGIKTTGYRIVALCRDGKAHTRPVHQLVLEAFIGPRPKLPPGERRIEARHLNGDPLDNSLRNLTWGTSGDNRFDSVRHGTHANAAKQVCKHGHELTDENVYVYQGRRDCRTCRQERVRKSYEARKGHT